MRVSTFWLWPLAVAFALYLVTSTALVFARWRYDRRRRLLARVEHAVRLDPPANSGATSPAMIVLSNASVASVRRLMFEHRPPRAADLVLAQYLVGVLGVERTEALATNTSGRTSRWKRIAALRILALARPREGIEALATATRAQDREVVAAAVTTLGNMSEPEAAAALVRTLTTGAFPRSRVATFLDRFPTDVSSLIRPLASDPSPLCRFWGALLLRRYASLPWAVEALTRLASDSASTVRKAALQSLATVDAEVTVDVAAKALQDPTWIVRAYAARALGARRAVTHAADVAALLADRQWWVRDAAKHALEQMGPGAEDALLALLSHPDRFARNSAAEVLQHFGTLQRLLAAEVLTPGDPGRRETLRLLHLAGDDRMARAEIERLPDDLRLQARDVLRACGWPNVAGRV